MARFVSTVACALLAFFPDRARGSAYPAINAATRWTAAWDGRYLQGVTKRIQLSATDFRDVQFFRWIRVEGFSWAGKDRSGFTTDSVGVDSSNAAYTVYKARHFAYIDTAHQYYLHTNYYLYKDGKFSLRHFWTPSPKRPAEYPPASANPQVMLSIDYDINGYIDDRFEVAKTVNGIKQWYADSTEVRYSFPASASGTSSGAIERNALARLIGYSSPRKELGVVFWSPNTALDMTFKKWSVSTYGGTPITPNPAVKIQYPYYDSRYQRYAQAPKENQMVFINLKYAGSDTATSRIDGKASVKPNARPLRINTYVMTGATNPDLNVIVANNRSAKNTLDELTNSSWAETRKTGLPNPSLSKRITESQLHAFMLGSRNASPSTYSTANREDMTDWFADMSVADDSLAGSPDVTGIMFDLGSYSSNGIEREGSAILDLTMRRILYASTATEIKRKQAHTFVHELGHTFNLQHDWDPCGGNYYFDEGCANSSVMTYSLGYGPDGKMQGSTTMSYSATALDWYWNGPTSWVKPGRYGVPWKGVAGPNHPPFPCALCAPL